MLPDVMPEPLVGIVMGSDSDLESMRPAVDVLREFRVPVEVRVLSAHRTPDDTLEYARAAAGRACA
jgi:5-(carboxyamino)imidazole ribonucleotide mutase